MIHACSPISMAGVLGLRGGEEGPQLFRSLDGITSTRYLLVVPGLTVLVNRCRPSPMEPEAALIMA